MKMDKNMLKVAFLGCGRIAKRHAEIIGGGVIKGAKLVALCDVDENKAKVMSDQYSIPYYCNFKKMIDEQDIDLVSILTPSGMHAEHVMQASEFKKHIVVEKPMALTVPDAEKMIKSCSENNVKLFVVKQNRFNLPVIKLREAIENNRFGKKVLGTVRVRWCRDQKYYDLDKWRGTWAQDGGVFTNQASHHIDLLNWMMGDVVSVFAKSSTALVDIETEDTGIAILTFKDGSKGIVEATTATRPKDLEGSLSILGEKGTVEIGGFAVNKLINWSFQDYTDADKNILNEFSTNPPDVYGFGHTAYYNHIVDCLQKGVEPIVDGAEGIKSIKLISAIYASIETGKEVFLKDNPTSNFLGKQKHELKL